MSMVIGRPSFFFFFFSCSRDDPWSLCSRSDGTVSLERNNSCSDDDETLLDAELLFLASAAGAVAIFGFSVDDAAGDAAEGVAVCGFLVDVAAGVDAAGAVAVFGFSVVDAAGDAAEGVAVCCFLVNVAAGVDATGDAGEAAGGVGGAAAAVAAANAATGDGGFARGVIVGLWASDPLVTLFAVAADVVSSPFFFLRLLPPSGLLLVSANLKRRHVRTVKRH